MANNEVNQSLASFFGLLSVSLIAFGIITGEWLAVVGILVVGALICRPTR